MQINLILLILVVFTLFGTTALASEIDIVELTIVTASYTFLSSSIYNRVVNSHLEIFNKADRCFAASSQIT